MALSWVAFLVVGLALSSLLAISLGLTRKSLKHARDTTPRTSDNQQHR